MLVAVIAAIGLLLSVAMSARARARLPADARVPVHAGLGGWDRYVPRDKGLWVWPAGVGIVGAALSLSALPGPTAAPVLLFSAAGLSLVLAIQWSAFRAAEKGSPPGDEARPQPVPKWIYIPVLALALVPLIAIAAMFLWPRGGPPSEVKLDGDHLVMTMRGPYKAFSLRSKIRVPLDSVAAVRAEPQALDLPRGFRVGTSAPGVIAGRFTSDHCRAFWAIDNGSHAVVIELHDADFDRLVAEVEDPVRVAEEIRHARPFQIEAGTRTSCDR